MQPLVDKLRSADMIVRELYSSAKADKENEMPYFFALVSIGEKRQMTVAEIMGKSGLIKLRMRKMDDIGLSLLPPSPCMSTFLLSRALLACAGSWERFSAVKTTSTPRTSQSWRECKPGGRQGGAQQARFGQAAARRVEGGAGSTRWRLGMPARHAQTPSMHPLSTLILPARGAHRERNQKWRCVDDFQAAPVAVLRKELRGHALQVLLLILTAHVCPRHRHPTLLLNAHGARALRARPLHYLEERMVEREWEA